MSLVHIKNKFDAWPELPFNSFKSTMHLLHRLTQMMGKLKLTAPFEPHWANVALWPISRGLTTGSIPYQGGLFDITLDTVQHKVVFNSSWNTNNEFKINSTSVDVLYKTFLHHLKELGVDLNINPQPQEIPNAVSFEQDKEKKNYENELTEAWWQIIINTYIVLEKFHARFSGISPPVGFMWGTFDLRDARYKNVAVKNPPKSFIERNAMDVEQVESGWWAGNDLYPKPAYFSFTYPKPDTIEQAKIKPETAYWNSTLGEFILDYDELRMTKSPAETLLEFFETAYAVGADLAKWDPDWITSGKPK